MDVLTIFVENHKTRSAQPIMAAIEREGETATVVTDTTDYYLRHGRVRGNLLNYVDILNRGTECTGWVVTMQDDVTVPPGLFRRMRHVLQFAPGPLVAFFVQTNPLMTKAAARGYHVVETYWSRVLCMAYQAVFLPGLVEWAIRHALPAPVEQSVADDLCVMRFCSYTQTPVRVILPSLVQHDDGGVSVWPGSRAHLCAGGRNGTRQSSCYQPDFNVTTVDWPSAFATALKSRQRDLLKDGLVGL